MANKAIHLVAEMQDAANGIAVVAKLLYQNDIGAEGEVWIHSTWTPDVIYLCLKALIQGKQVVRMPHGNLAPVRLKYHGLRKGFVAPIERFLFRHSSKIIATCEAERNWIKAFVGFRCPPIEILDLKQFFKLNNCSLGLTSISKNHPLHLLYLGRRHPLKGIEFLEQAVRELLADNDHNKKLDAELKIVSNAFGAEKEKVWDWCDVLVLPTLSENFGLVVAEALERGKRVITTDGAPAWEQEIRETHEKDVWEGYNGRLLYLKGYRDGEREKRVELLKKAIELLVR